MGPDSLIFQRKWWKYTGDLALLNGNVLYARLGIVAETNVTRQSAFGRVPRMWMTYEIKSKPGDKDWQEINRFKIFRYKVVGYHIGDNTVNPFVIQELWVETGLCTFGEWVETVEPEEFHGKEFDEMYGLISRLELA